MPVLTIALLVFLLAALPHSVPLPLASLRSVTGATLPLLLLLLLLLQKNTVI